MIGRDDGGNAGGMLQLTQDMRAQGARPLWLGYLAVPDVDEATRAIQADGGSTMMRMELPVGRIAMVADPMGSPFYVMTPVPPPGQPDAVSEVFHPDAVQHVRWNELASPDLARAKDFYTKHFDFAFNEVMPMGPLGDYCFIDHGGLRIGAIMQKPEHSPAAAWQFYFGVNSIAAAQRAIEAGGGRVVNGPHQVPRGDWVLMAIDPQGAPFGVAAPNP
jgi:predicted enzyme related to lactoylglutathione lyase